MTSVRRALCLALAVLSLAPAVAAQSGQTIPKELVTALLRGGMGPSDNFDLRVGPPPADFPKDVLPVGTDVALSAVSDRSVTVVGTAAGLPMSKRDEYLQSLLKLGWQNTVAPQRGFVSTLGSQTMQVCRENDFVGLSLIPRTEGGTYVRATLTHDVRRRCEARPMMMETMFADISVPALVAPEGARSSGGGGGGGTDSWTSNSRIVLAMKVNSIAEHYRKQLDEAGWKMKGKPIESDDSSVTQYTIPSKAGDPVIGLLVITSLTGANQVDLFLRVTRTGDGRGGAIIR